MSQTEYRQVLRALALGDGETADRLIDQMDANEDHGDFVSAVFCVVVERRFKSDGSADAVRAFIDEARLNFAQVDPPFKPLAAEAMVRTVLNPDEADLLDELDPNQQVPVQLALIRKIVAESAQLTNQIDDVLDDAEKILHYWAEQG